MWINNQLGVHVTGPKTQKRLYLNIDDRYETGKCVVG